MHITIQIGENPKFGDTVTAEIDGHKCEMMIACTGQASDGRFLKFDLSFVAKNYQRGPNLDRITILYPNGLISH